MSAASIAPAPDVIDSAARWILDHPDAPRPLLPTLRRRFGLDIGAAVAAIRRANEMRRAVE